MPPKERKKKTKQEFKFFKIKLSEWHFLISVWGTLAVTVTAFRLDQDSQIKLVPTLKEFNLVVVLDCQG